jgi:hypothetical protein
LNPDEEEVAMAKLQRACARARATDTASGWWLNAERMVLLPRNGPLQLAWGAKIGQWYILHHPPAAGLRASGQEVFSVAAIYMEIASPLLVHYEGLLFYDQRSQSGPVRRST